MDYNVTLVTLTCDESPYKYLAEVVGVAPWLLLLSTAVLLPLLCGSRRKTPHAKAELIPLREVSCIDGNTHALRYACM